MDEIAVKVDGVYKDFNLPDEKLSSMKSHIVHPFKRRNYKRQHALKDINLEIKKGEFFGIVGRNGSGKSTLLKIIAGIYQPTKGKVTLNGKLVPFIELGVGFNPELTGKENVYLNGALLGFSKKEIDEQYDDIVAFAELKPFMNQKLKNYSSGMQVRLAFSVAVRANADILLIDEVLAVGDADFQRKCFEYFKHLKSEKITVIFVSHNMDAVRQFCNRAILIEKGILQTQGETDQIARAYTELFSASEVGTSSTDRQNRWGESPNAIKKIGTNVNSKTVTVKGVIVTKRDQDNPIFGFAVKNTEGVSVLGANNSSLEVKLPRLTAGKDYAFKISFENVLSDGNYSVDLALLKEDGLTVIDWWTDALKLTIKKDRQSPYLVSPNMNLSVIEGDTHV